MIRTAWQSSVIACAIASLLAAAVPVAPVMAQAAPRATVYVVSGTVPRSVGSAQDLVRYARSHRARQLQESTAEPMDRRKWYADVVVQFAQPLPGRSFTILLYDVTDGERSLLGNPSDVFFGSATQTTIVQEIRMERPTFRPNRDIEVVVTVQRREVGRTRVRIVGEVPRHSGSLDFTQADPEAR